MWPFSLAKKVRPAVASSGLEVRRVRCCSSILMRIDRWFFVNAGIVCDQVRSFDLSLSLASSPTGND
jgi:hypothetical protein